ncbi:MAG: sigma-70 family RNA polymerase sigma factor [Spirochaetes bacterium]|nr:sigma-70 family RNA polymerase sigma factor [Spirochaetota bacterium]
MKDDLKEKIKKIYEISSRKGFITFEEINEIMGEADPEQIDKMFMALEEKGVKIQDRSQEPQRSSKGKWEESVHNYIDTPEKFYFVELEKLDKTRVSTYSSQFKKIKNDIRDHVLHSNYFVFRLLKDFYRVKRKKKNFSQIFRDTTHYNKKDFIRFADRIKALCKGMIVLSRHKNRDNRAYRKKRDELFTLIGRMKYKFTYMKDGIYDLQEYKERYNEIKNRYKKILIKYKLKPEDFKRIVSDLTDHHCLPMPVPAPVEKAIQEWLKKEKALLNFRTSFRMENDQIRKITNRLNRLLKEYEKIKELVINSSLPLVIGIARYYSYRGIGIHDLIQEGNLAVVEACEKYDSDSEKEFSAYVSWWIRKKMSESVMKNNESVKISRLLKNDIKLFTRAVNELRGALLRNPTREELARKLQWEEKKLEQIMTILKKVVSLDGASGDETKPLRDYLYNPDNLSPDEIVMNNMIKEKMTQIVSKLSDIEQQVIKMRYGLGENVPYYYDKISSLLKLPVKSIKDIEKKALKKLKFWGKKDNLDDFLD